MTGKGQGPEIPIQTPYTEYILSQDIGKKQDATTSMLYRITPEYIDSADGTRRVTTFMDVVFMDKRRLSYMELGDYTSEMMQAIALGDRCINLIDGTGIGGSSGHNHLGLDFLGNGFHMVVVDGFGVVLHSVGMELKVFAGQVHRGAVGQMSPVG